MKLTIYVENRFALLEDYYQLSILANQDSSLVVIYKHISTAWRRDYNTLDQLINDGDLLPLWKWIARGLLGIPLDIKNEVIHFHELPQEYLDQMKI